MKFFHIFCVLVLSLNAFSQTKHAILVGVGAYPKNDSIKGKWKDLSSMNDLKIIENMLLQGPDCGEGSVNTQWAFAPHTHRVDQKGQTANVVQVGMGNQYMLNLLETGEIKFAQACARIDQNIAVDQKASCSLSGNTDTAAATQHLYRRVFLHQSLVRMTTALLCSFVKQAQYIRNCLTPCLVTQGNDLFSSLKLHQSDFFNGGLNIQVTDHFGLP